MQWCLKNPSDKISIWIALVASNWAEANKDWALIENKICVKLQRWCIKGKQDA